MESPEGRSWLASDDDFTAVALIHGGVPATVWVSPRENRAVLRAARVLAEDLARVAGSTAGPDVQISDDLPRTAARRVIVMGTVEVSPLIRSLVERRFLSVDSIVGRWESTLVQSVVAPWEGIDACACLVGSDRRGAIYGAVALAEQLGVSPWHWWSDSPVAIRSDARLAGGPFVIAEPRVKYRGIFLNDEYPNLTRWVAHRWGHCQPSESPPRSEGIAAYGREFYAHVFDLVLRLRGNTVWPAMWNNAFAEDDEGNLDLADEYAIVMGTSHQEPMCRAQKEWDRRYFTTEGSWDWTRHADLLQAFWKEGLERNRHYESLITLGLRGADDTEMAGVGPEARRAMISDIVRSQRAMIDQESQRSAYPLGQVWCLYKEVLDDYRAGLRVPDDVTLLWGEDNWGNLRRVPTSKEQARPGGAGIYYHLDYHGGPRSYQWLNTSPLGKIQEQMSLAAEYGADRLWMVNVGHLKGYELPLEFFLRFAWNPDRWGTTSTTEFTRLWAEREFGPLFGQPVAELLENYTLWNGRRKPELLDAETYSLLHYRESESVVGQWSALEERAADLQESLDPSHQDSYQQTVLFPIRACALLHRLLREAGLSRLYESQGRASADDHARRARELFSDDLELMAWYNTVFAGGRWKHFMDQTHIGYTSWNDPPENTLDAIRLGRSSVLDGQHPGLHLEGAIQRFSFDCWAPRPIRFELFRRGSLGFDFTVEAEHPWVRLSVNRGTVWDDAAGEVSVLWDLVPEGVTTSSVRFTLGHEVHTVALEVRNLPVYPGFGFLATEGVVAIEAEHAWKVSRAQDFRWERVSPYGHTLSAMRAVFSPCSAAEKSKCADNAQLEYRFHVFEGSPAVLVLILGPVLNLHEDHDIALGWSLDGSDLERKVVVGRDYVAQHHNADWEKTVADNHRQLRIDVGTLEPGWHNLGLVVTEPGVIVQRVLVDLGGLKPSYLGPPESPHFPPTSPLTKGKLQ